VLREVVALVAVVIVETVVEFVEVVGVVGQRIPKVDHHVLFPLRFRILVADNHAWVPTN